MKTLVISFSAHTVFRNLFLFPGGFWDQCKKWLEKDSRARVVILLRGRDLEKYRYLFEGLSPKQLIIETVDVPKAKKFSQKLFRFFYAYLLYTNTTKILTTIGMRQDEPPATGNRLLAPIRVVLGFLGRHFPWLRYGVVPYLHGRIFPERPFQGVFDRYQPDLIFATHIYGDYDAFFIREARRRGVRSVAMPSGWDHLDKYFLPFRADFLLAPSAQVKEHATRFQGYQKESVEVTGYQHFDYLVSKEALMSVAELYETLRLPHGCRYILYVSGSAYCPDEPDIIEKVVGWIDEGIFGPNVKLILRPYLGSRSKDRDFDKAKFERLAHNPNVIYYDSKSWDTLRDSKLFINLMRYASVVMCVYSTVFLEAVLFDRPLVATPFDGYQKRPYRRSIRRFADFEHFKEVLEVGAIREAHNFEELKSSLLSYFKNPKQDADKRELMRKKVCYLLDGQASLRTLDIIRRELFQH